MKTLLESILSKSKVSSSVIEDACVTSEICDLYCDIAINKPRTSQEWIRNRQLYDDKYFSVSAGILTCKKLRGSEILVSFIQQAHEKYRINTIKFTRNIKDIYMHARIMRGDDNSLIDGVRFETECSVHLNIFSPTKFINCAFVNINSGPVSIQRDVITFNSECVSFENCKFENICFMSQISPLDKYIHNCDFNDTCTIIINLDAFHAQKLDEHLYYELKNLGIVDSSREGHAGNGWTLATSKDGKNYILDPKKSYKSFIDLILPGNNVSLKVSIILGPRGYHRLYITKQKHSQHILSNDFYDKVQLHDGTWVYAD